MRNDRHEAERMPESRGGLMLFARLLIWSMRNVRAR